MAHIELDLSERRTFYTLMDRKLPIARIAEMMDRHRSTLYRELKRNYWHDKDIPYASGYFPVTAQGLAEERRSRQRKLVRFPDLLVEVIDRLKHDWTPEQIAGRLKIEKFAPLTICHETIYQYIYSKDGLALGLGKLLPSRRKKRLPRYARRVRGNIFPDMVSIKHRPEKVNERKEFGHWEGDLMIFERAQGTANVATVVERTSRFTVIFKNNDRRSKPIMEKLITQLSPLPSAARQSITFDRGFEFVSWRELYKGMGMKAWFCDPSAPWQKGSVENMNKRARRRLPRDTALLSIPEREMRRINDNLNATPRKCLGYRTPAEVFSENLQRIQRDGG